MNNIREILSTWRLSNLEQAIELVEGHELTVDDLRDIDGADLNTLLQYLPLKQKIQFKRELKTWLSEDKNQNVQQDDVPSDFQENLEKILMTSAKGRNLLKVAKDSPLDSTQQKDLTWSIVTFLGDRGHKLRTSNGQFYAAEIARVFPHENPKFYYEIINGRPKGKLFNRAKNNKLKDPSEQEIEQIANVQEVIIPVIEIEDDIKSKECKQWLRHHREPWSEVIENWRVTHSLRRRDLKSCKTAELFCEWPLLKHSLANQLLDIDFDILFPGKKYLLLENWDLGVEKLLPILDKEIKDATCREYLERIKEKNISQDERDLLILRAVHGLIKPTHYPKKGNKRFKPTIVDAQKSLCLELTGFDKLNDSLKKLYESAKERGETVQPFILTDQSMKEFVTYYDDHYFKSSSFKAALDLTFKIFYVFDTQYPIQCNSVWKFIQYYFYNITDDIENSMITSLISRINFEK